MSFCKHCIEGVVHEGETTGTIETIGGVRTYIATPSQDFPKDKAVLILTDVFGLELNNNRLLADAYAKNGFKVFMPDLFDGDSVAADALNPGSNFDLMEWFGRHGPQIITPIIDNVIAAANEQGFKIFAGVGYCFGARYVFNLAFENKISVSVTAHPTMIQVEDLQKYLEVSKAPLLINSCTTDPQFPPEKIEAADRILGGGKFAPGYERVHWEGCTHGFAVRGDISDPKIKASKEGCFKKCVEFLIAKL
ncbi:chlorocatechol-degradation protein [Stereum hirsutum FP-91666 SS1]|uniref:chlorocatechol-degradation protein n=1 Tax=Stereum hirsutum (strain FP-91666) TaxID=721885 RepID=UPI0004449D51|nr:chlorocatechol-degradation protein [Stereum hirsutum FP-91666 SS1]EIM81993.1 chlorocatechol-degradation protein [Stereum hirsutum FP-91666 SS1]